MKTISIDERFEKFHERHPEVYAKFRQLAMEVRGRGIARYGAKAIWERLRWHFVIERRDADFKLNNSLVSRYARLLAENEPEKFAGFFEMRRLKS